MEMDVVHGVHNRCGLRCAGAHVILHVTSTSAQESQGHEPSFNTVRDLGRHRTENCKDSSCA